jgi:hypothetical protein
MFSVFLCPRGRDIQSIELSESEDEELLAHNGKQRISSLYVHGKLRCSVEITKYELFGLLFPF